ncbi:hypothetical protein N0O92_08750 [Alkalihalobacillus sp. MEB130]|nr:hypothetical protein [Alkalihalobacillus sp. MEB130]MDT8860320.1 hypothetical protein [Alkalihalobacillus sp. MEB130]
MFYTPEELHRKKKVKRAVIIGSMSILGVGVAVAASLLGSL